MWLPRKNQINNSQTSPSRKSPSSNFNRHSLKNIKDLLVDDDKSVPNDQKQQKPQKQLKQKQKQKQKQPSGSSPVSAKQRQPVFHRVRLANQFTRSLATPRQKSIANEKPRKSETPIKIPENRIVVYMTSLGVVRPTFDACRAVRSILQGFRVAVEERDLSMDCSFKDELRKIMMSQGGGEINAGGVPRVFIGGRYVGDAEELRQMNESGELKKIVEELPAVSRGVCEGCGDFRFIICMDCYGSRKCYKQKGGFRVCMRCNKNGLVKCPTCWTDK